MSLSHERKLFVSFALPILLIIGVYRFLSRRAILINGAFCGWSINRKMLQ